MRDRLNDQKEGHLVVSLRFVATYVNSRKFYVDFLFMKKRAVHECPSQRVQTQPIVLHYAHFTGAGGHADRLYRKRVGSDRDTKLRTHLRSVSRECAL